jgi:hypothetical protein
MEPQHWWLLFGVFGSLLPAYLLVLAVLHILGYGPRAQRWRSQR